MPFPQSKEANYRRPENNTNLGLGIDENIVMVHPVTAGPQQFVQLCDGYVSKRVPLKKFTAGLSVQGKVSVWKGELGKSGELTETKRLQRR